jgi:hypothetical protein
MPDTFPALRCSTEQWRLQNAARSGGQTLSGVQQFVGSPSAQWRAKMAFHLVEDDDYLAARGFIAGLSGQTVPFLIGPTDWRGQPWNIDPLIGSPITPGIAAASAAANPGYASNPDTTGFIDFELAFDAAMNSTRVTIKRNKGGLLRAGQYFQIGDRLHIITGLNAADTGQENAGVDLNIRPWLRGDYASGYKLNFANPRCLMRLADGDQGAIDMNSGPLSSLSLDIIEAF